MKEVIGFLEQLEQHNDREWFNQHKDQYRAAQARFDDFAGQLIAGIATFDDSIRNLTAKDCTYRIYRDTRFSSDKRPYKTHIGAFICPGGKKSGYAGYYFQVGPQEAGYDAGTMLASGHYLMEPQALRTLREDICNGDGDFEQTLHQAPDFQLDEEGKLKRVPNGFPKDAQSFRPGRPAAGADRGIVPVDLSVHRICQPRHCLHAGRTLNPIRL